ncbi:MAG: polysaccharide deacetylase family protein [Candidatus Omnitrophota bacterium]
MKNILTIDYEDMSHSRFDHSFTESGEIDQGLLRPATDELLELLDKYGFKATFFVLGIIAEKMPEVIKKISSLGHEIASHGYYHTPVYRLKPVEFRDDLRRSIRVIEDITQKTVIGYRAPYWSITKESLWAMDIIKESNLRYDSSISPAVNFLYGIRGAARLSYRHTTGLWEIPPSTVKILNKTVIVGGGFYLRALPYWFTRGCVRSMNRKNIPALVYLHPHEIMGYSSKHKISIKDDFVLNFRKNTFKAKLIGLFNDFKFCPVSEALGLN